MVVELEPGVKGKLLVRRELQPLLSNFIDASNCTVGS